MAKKNSWGGGFNRADKPNATANQFRCPRCAKRFPSAGKLKTHWLLTGHTKPRGT